MSAIGEVGGLDFWLARQRWRRESDLHPHCEEERARLFLSASPGSAELETLRLLHALVCMTKPERCLETGTGLGLTTTAIALALKENGFGRLTTVETDKGSFEAAQESVSQEAGELSSVVSFIHGSSLSLIEAWDEGPLDFVFFDSLIAFRPVEFEKLKERGLLAPGALCVFHDTSRLRGRSMGDHNPQMIEALDRIAEGAEHLEFHLSRGLRVLRARP